MLVNYVKKLKAYINKHVRTVGFIDYWFHGITLRSSKLLKIIYLDNFELKKFFDVQFWWNTDLEHSHH